ncbi:MAG: helix-turn-helix domain-containing protein, partial [Pseudomonadota bacterium]|nr:helix-turn-helix domain-containing protein [Pseudomonadota bacterium]
LRGHGFGTARLRQGPYDEWLDGVSDALAYGLRWLRDLRPLRHYGHTHAPTPAADYPPRASHFHGGQRLMKAVALCPDTVLTRELFAADLCSTPALAEADRPLNDLSLAEMERRHVQRILETTGWHRGRACEILGVSRPRLRRLIRDHGLSPPESVEPNGAPEEKN